MSQANAKQKIHGSNSSLQLVLRHDYYLGELRNKS